MIDSTIEELLNKVKAGDPDAVTELISGYYPLMYKTALGIVGDPSDAQDVVQDASLKMIRSINQLDKASSFEPWVKRIVRNEALDNLKTAYNKHNVMWTDLSSATDDGEMEYDPADERIDSQPQMVYDAKVKQEIILEVLNDLPVDQRTVLQMYFYDGMKLQEIAEELGVPLSTVTGRLQKAKNKVKTSVTEIQKRDGIKLYSLQPLPFFLYLLRWWKGDEVNVPPMGGVTRVIQTEARSITAESAKRSAESVAVSAAEKTAAAVGKTGMSLLSKLLITGVLTAAAGGGILLYQNSWNTDNHLPSAENTPVAENTSEETVETTAVPEETPEPDNGLTREGFLYSREEILNYIQGLGVFTEGSPTVLETDENGVTYSASLLSESTPKIQDSYMISGNDDEFHQFVYIDNPQSTAGIRSSFRSTTVLEGPTYVTIEVMDQDDLLNIFFYLGGDNGKMSLVSLTRDGEFVRWDDVVFSDGPEWLTADDGYYFNTIQSGTDDLLSKINMDLDDLIDMDQLYHVISEN